MLTGECRAKCHKGRRRLLEELLGGDDPGSGWHDRVGFFRGKEGEGTVTHVESLFPESRGLLTKDDPNEKVAVCRRPVRFV